MQAVSPLPQGATQAESRVAQEGGDTPPSSFFIHLSVAGRQAHVIQAYIKHQTYSMHTVRRKTITIREDQEEWIQENHLNLSSFVQEQLDELIEERES